MHTDTQNTPQNTFDGLVIGPVGNSMPSPRSGPNAEGVPKLDLGTLDDTTRIRINAEALGITEFGGGVGWAVTVKDYGDNHYEVVGRHTREGNLPSKRTGTKKKRATQRSEISDESAQASIRRSKKRAREIGIMLRPTNFMTLTTRDAVVDADVFREIYSRFRRSIAKHCNGLKYLATFERHMSVKTSQGKYGSIHAHVIVNYKGVLPYARLWHLWRVAVQSVLKNDDYEGAHVNFQPVKTANRTKVIRYAVKYISKDMDNEDFEPNRRRYWASAGIESPKKIKMFIPPSLFDETFRTVFEEILRCDLSKVWFPDVLKGAPPIFWMSSA